MLLKRQFVATLVVSAITLSPALGQTAGAPMPHHTTHHHYRDMHPHHRLRHHHRGPVHHHHQALTR
jgi:hypothetical protein